MIISSFFDKTKIPFLNNAMDAYSLRHQVISENIANIGTPEYRSKRVSFEDQFSEAVGRRTISIERTNENHIPIGKSQNGEINPNVYEQNTGNLLASGNNDVNIDFEMAELAKNQINYKFSTRLVNDIFKGLQKSIRGTL